MVSQVFVIFSLSFLVVVVGLPNLCATMMYLTYTNMLIVNLEDVLNMMKVNGIQSIWDTFVII
jgi:hypothetical protein